MSFRTILRTGDTGSLDRGHVREAVIRLRDRKRAEAGAPPSRYRYRPGTGVMIARERPIVPYGTSEALPDGGDEGEEP